MPKFDFIAKMTRQSALVFGSTLALALIAPAASAGDGLYSVQLNKTEILRLPADAGTVIVGNPDIADVSIHAANTIFVVGKGYGETNLIILDKNGNTMMSSDIQVITPQSQNQVRIFNSGRGRQTYNCGPHCNPSPTLGDSQSFVEGNTGESDPLSNFFASAAQAFSGGEPTTTSSGSDFGVPPS
jgi:hypothetical protein